MVVNMAKSGTTLVKTQRIQGFYAVLTSAACEWFLIFLLLINAAISYLSTKFARYCDLQTPCVLCSRIDHVMSGEKQKQEWYQNLLCGNHRSEISSLVSCHIHDKVSHGHGMCDNCLMSFAPDDKTHSKTHRLLLGKLGPAPGNRASQSPLPNRDTFTSSMGSQPCSCCGKFWNSMQSSQRCLLLKSPRIGDFKPRFRLPDIYRKNSLNKICEKPSCLGRRSSDSLSNYAEYTEVKLASDSESEFEFSDDDDIIGSQNHENIEARNNLMPPFTAVALSQCLPSDSNPTRPHNISSETEPLILFPCVKPGVINHPHVSSTVSDAVNDDYGFGQIKWQQPNQKSLTSELPELISLNEASPSSDVVDIPSQEPEGSKITCLSKNSLPAALAELVTSDAHPPAGTSSKKFSDDTQARDIGWLSKNHEEGLEETVTIARASTESATCEDDSAFSSRRNDESTNVNELPITNEETEAPGFVHEHRTPTEVNGVNEEPKRSHSPNSSPRGSSSMSSVVPVNHVNALEMQTDASRSNGIQELQKAPSIEPVLGSLEGCSVSEIEGESTVGQLKRQVEHDKKCISALYKELEEERNASAIAANQSMAMITRLQEEKAVLHMEALQYLRMMDEQAEYDGEELEKAYDLLAEKEKEIQDLEAALEFYRLNMEEEPMSHDMQKERCDLNGKTITVHNFSAPPITISSNSKLAESSQVTYKSVAHETALEFEEEKLYISNCLSSLEKKLHQISDNGISFNMPTDRPENFEENEPDPQGASNGEGPRLDSQKDNNAWSIKEDYNTSNGNITSQDGSIASKSEICSPCEENDHSVSIGQKNSMQSKNVDLVSIENEISDLNKRLEALEADHDLLKHILHSLREDNDGLKFIRDIARQLHELRKLGSRIR